MIEVWLNDHHHQNIRIIIFTIIVMSILFCNTRLNVVSGGKGSICQNSQRGEVRFVFCRFLHLDGLVLEMPPRLKMSNVCSYSCQLIFRSRPSQVFGTKQRLIKTTHNSKHAWLMTRWTKTNYSWKCHTFPNLFNILFAQPWTGKRTIKIVLINHVCATNCGFW